MTVTATTHRPHFAALDGLRGVAALVVLAIHTHAMFGEGLWLRHGYLAVDFFFLLSGFVLSHAYGAPMREGLGFAGLMRLRLLRLYPLVLLGTLIGIAAMLAGPPVPAMAFTAAIGRGLLLLPNPDAVLGDRSLWPLNPPSWSLFWEFLASAAFAAGLWRLPTRWLALVVLAGALALGWTAFHFDTLEVGNLGRNFVGGFTRTWFAFGAGVLLHRGFQSGVHLPGMPMPLAALALAGLLCFPWDSWRGLYDLAAVTLAFPLLLLAAANISRAGPIWSAAGRLSYPLYILHSPVLLFVHQLLPDSGIHILTQAILGAVLALVAAHLAQRHIEAPLIAWMRSRRTAAMA